jgi:type I restriction enzyme S subunit
MNAVLPPGWRHGRLADVIASISAGVSVNGEDRPVREGEVGVLKITAILRGVFEPDHHKAVVGSERQRLTISVKGNTILVSRGNGNPEYVGAAAYVPDGQPNLFLPDLLWQLTPAPHVSGEWLGLLLGSRLMRPHIARIAVSTSTLKKISQSQYLALPIPIPPSHEQDQIVEILKTWERGVATANGLVAAAVLHVSGLASQHLDAFIPGSSRENTSLPLIQLGDAFDERAETGHESEQLLAITGERGVVPREDIERRDNSAEDKGAYRLILPGDIGYNTMRMWQGVCGLSTLRGIISPAYTVVTPKPGIMDGAFAGALFKAPHMIEWLRRYSQGIVDDTLNLKFEQFRQIHIRLPSLDTQRRVANAIHAIRAEADVTARLATKLREQKLALMTRLLSGALRVSPREAAENRMTEKAHA